MFWYLMSLVVSHVHQSHVALKALVVLMWDATH